MNKAKAVCKVCNIEFEFRYWVGRVRNLCSRKCSIVVTNKCLIPNKAIWKDITPEQRMEKIKQLYYDKVIYPAKPDDCYGWKGYKDFKGYAKVIINKKIHGGNRISWLLNYGEIPEGMFVLHRCDNPICTKIVGDPEKDHLFLGTHKDNMRDMVAKGRNHKRHGELVPNAKLTDAKVIEIKKLIKQGILSHKKISLLFNVGATTIDDIALGVRWKHVKD